MGFHVLTYQMRSIGCEATRSVIQNLARRMVAARWHSSSRVWRIRQRLLRSSRQHFVKHTVNPMLWNYGFNDLILLVQCYILECSS